jgi:mRNA interferase YafQ
LPRTVQYSKTFIKDWERLSRSGRFDMTVLKEAMMLLIANEGPLGPEWHDHPLKGNWSGARECHIGGDFLLIYERDDDDKTGAISFTRAGTHSDLFDE